VEGAPEGDAVLRPFDEVFGVEVAVEGLGHDVEVYVVVVQHVEERELAECSHLLTILVIFTKK
jgi:hypothetical protein